MPSDSEVDRLDCRTSKRTKTSHTSATDDDHQLGQPPAPTPDNVKTPAPINTQAMSVSEPTSCRKKQPLSCGECRRLKLKCDRVFPCRACVKRGCEGICPDGSLVSGRGSRYILANTEQLHEKIVKMSDRIRELENALCTLHAQHCLCSGQSVSSHPLLQGPQLLVKAHLELYGIEPSRSNPNSPTSTGSSEISGDLDMPNASLSNAATVHQSLTWDSDPSSLSESSFGAIAFESTDEAISPMAPVNETYDTASPPKPSGMSSDVNAPQSPMDLSMPSILGGMEMFDMSSFGHLTDPFTFDNPSNSAAAGGMALPSLDSRPRTNTECGSLSTPITSGLNVPAPAISLDRYFVTWLTQLWLSHMANPNLPGASHIPLNSTWNVLKHPDHSSILAPSADGVTRGDEAATWMRLLTQHYGDYQPFS